MGFNTDYIGAFTINPQLNEAETEWLRAYAVCPGPGGPSGPYELAMNPRQAGHDPNDRELRQRYGWDGWPPGPTCGWEPSACGGFLSWTGQERSNDAREWIPYLIDHFLREGAHASRSGVADFEAFTFDHVVNGAVAASRQDSGRLYLLLLEDNTLRRLTVAAGEWAEPECKPYIDYGEEDQDAAVSITRMHALARRHGVNDSGRTRHHDAQHGLPW